MASPEKMFCTMLEQQYGVVRSLIDAALAAPAFALSSLRSAILRIKNIVYAAIEAALDVLAAQLNTILGLDDIDRNETKDAFCRVAFECQALRDILFSDTTLDVMFFWLSDSEKQAIQDNFDDFQELICEVGLANLITGWTDSILNTISDELDRLADKLLGILGIQELIDKYLAFLEDSGIYDLLDQLDSFANCGFAICDFIATASNGKEDYEKKLNIQKVNGSWIYVVDDALQSVYDTDAELTSKIDSMRRQISLWRNSQTRDAKKGKRIDEILFP